METIQGTHISLMIAELAFLNSRNRSTRPCKAKTLTESREQQLSDEPIPYLADQRLVQTLWVVGGHDKYTAWVLDVCKTRGCSARII